ncbi:hypothetical protein JG687_00007638, partial [Phytophthora cactorum]
MATKLQAIRFVVNPFRYICRTSSPLSTCRFQPTDPGTRKLLSGGYPSCPGKADWQVLE